MHLFIYLVIPNGLWLTREHEIGELIRDSSYQWSSLYLVYYEGTRYSTSIIQEIGLLLHEIIIYSIVIFTFIALCLTSFMT